MKRVGAEAVRQLLGERTGAPQDRFAAGAAGNQEHNGGAGGGADDGGERSDEPAEQDTARNGEDRRPRDRERDRRHVGRDEHRDGEAVAGGDEAFDRGAVAHQRLERQEAVPAHGKDHGHDENHDRDRGQPTQPLPRARLIAPGALRHGSLVEVHRLAMFKRCQRRGYTRSGAPAQPAIECLATA